MLYNLNCCQMVSSIKLQKRFRKIICEDRAPSLCLLTFTPSPGLSDFLPHLTSSPPTSSPHHLLTPSPTLPHLLCTHLPSLACSPLQPFSLPTCSTPICATSPAFPPSTLPSPATPLPTLPSPPPALLSPYLMKRSRRGRSRRLYQLSSRSTEGGPFSRKNLRRVGPPQSQNQAFPQT